MDFFRLVRTKPLPTLSWLLSLIVVSLSLSPVVGPFASASSADGARPAGQEKGRVGCPNCRNDGSEISQLLQRADDLYGELKINEALRELMRVLKLDPQNHEALAKIARVYIDFGDRIAETEPDWQEKRLKQYRTAEDYARKAIQADPKSTWGHFYAAASLGKIAALSPVPKQIDLSREVRVEVEKAIAADPQNGFAYHLYGVWHRKMAEIGQMRRVVANMVLWRSVPKGSLEKSVEYLNKAVSLNPRVIVHYVELGRTYIAAEQWQLARKALTRARELPEEFSDDPLNKKEAGDLLREIKDR